MFQIALVWQFLSATYSTITRASGAVLGSDRHFDRLRRKNSEDAKCAGAIICLMT